MANIGDLVQVTNNDDTELVIRWDGRDWKVGPHKTGMVLFDAVAHRFGNPFCGDAVQQGVTQYGQTFYVPSRREEEQRMAIRWGYHPGDHPEMYPDVTVRDEEDNEMYFLIHNPDGTLTQPLVTTTPSQQEQINALKSQMRMLEATMAANNPELNIPGVKVEPRGDDEEVDSVPVDN